jgi:hypothetical protein
MLPFSDGKHDVYSDDMLQVMCTAFDTAVQLLPMKERGGEWRCSSFNTWIEASPPGILAI